MKNLLNETIKILKDNGKTPEDVFECFTDKISFSWKEFKDVADFEYDSGFGAEEINQQLVIRDSDWWIERMSHDGSEWWEFKKMPLTPVKNPYKTLTRNDLYSDEFINLERY